MWTGIAVGVAAAIGILFFSRARSDADPEALWERAKAFAAAGRWHEALPACLRAVKALRAAKHAALADALVDLATTQLRLGRAKDAKDNALEAFSLVPEEPSARAAGILASVAQVLWATGERDRGLATLERALAICEQVSCGSKPALLYMLAGMLDDAGEHAKAIELFEQIIETCRSATHGENRGYAAMALAGLGAAYAHAGDRSKAGDALQRAERAYVELFGENHPETKALRADIAAFHKTSP